MILCLFLTGALLSAAEPEITAVLSPATVAAGERFTLTLSSNSGELPELQEAPDFQYLGASQSTRILNGAKEISVSYTFVAGEPGSYKLPPLGVKLGSRTVKTPPLALTVVKADDIKLPGGEEVFAKGAFGNGDRTDYYVGEEIPLFIRVYYPESDRMRFEMNYPQIDTGKSVSRDFRAVNPDNPNFAQPTHGRQRIDDRVFTRIGFQTIFRPLAPGKLQVTAKVQGNVLLQEQSRSRDPFADFFGSGNYRRIPRTLEVELPELTIKPLPAAPAGVLFLGLVGDYNGTVKLSTNSIEAQEPLTLSIELNGTSSFETLNAPKLELPDCRVYPPEINTSGNYTVIRYAVIPLKSGQLPLKTVFATFDPVSGQYQSFALNTTLEVKPSTRPAGSAAHDYIAPGKTAPAPDDTAKKPESERTTLLYCKTAPGQPVSQPWWRNQLGVLLLLALAGPLFFLLHEWHFRRQLRRAADPTLQRRNRAAAAHSTLRRQLLNCPAGELPHLATGELTGYLCDRWNLPPGSTPEQVADAARDPEMAAALRQCGELSYLPPEMAATVLEKEAPRLRRILLTGFKLLALSCVFGVMNAKAEEAKPAACPANWTDALGAYDRGDYPQAEEFFRQRLQSDGNDPNVLYNLGCIKAAENEPEKSLWYFERAGLLNPGDSAIRENQNVLRRRFFLPEKGAAATPRELLLMLRDRWRPDHYWFLAGILWSACWVGLSFRRRWTPMVNWSFVLVLAIGMVLSIIAMITQLQSTYDSSRGLITVKSAELYSLPGRHNGQRLGVLPGGTPVVILEERQDYTHVTGNALEGWVASPSVGKLP